MDLHRVRPRLGLLGAFVFLAIGSSAHAAALYSVTDLGEFPQQFLQSNTPNGGVYQLQTVQNAQPGDNYPTVTIAFPVTVTSTLPVSEASLALPTKLAEQGVTRPIPTLCTMTVVAANAQECHRRPSVERPIL